MTGEEIEWVESPVVHGRAAGSVWQARLNQMKERPGQWARFRGFKGATVPTKDIKKAAEALDIEVQALSKRTADDAEGTRSVYLMVVPS